MAQLTVINVLSFIVDKAMEVLNGVDISKPKVVWFGLNGHVEYIQKALISRGKRLHYIVDNNVEKWGICLEGDLVVFPVEQMVRNYKDNAVFLISSKFEPEMRQQLMGSGVHQSQIVSLPTYEEADELGEKFLFSQTVGMKEIEHREMQFVMLDIMKALRDFCVESRLRYFLAGGTLLGAIRHKGFIPWNKDADIYLPYIDYLRFIEKFPIGGRYEVINWKNYPIYFKSHSKLVDNDTLMIVKGEFFVKRSHGVSICVIPIAGYPDGEKEFTQKYSINKRLDSKWYQYQVLRDIVFDELHDIRRDIEELKYNMPFDGSPLIGKAHLMHKPMWAVPNSVFSEPVQVEFEGELFSAPIGYDYYLKHRFGDYMQIPPENERQHKGLVPFWKE